MHACVDTGEASRARISRGIVDRCLEHVGEQDGVGQRNEVLLACKAQVDPAQVKGAAVLRGQLCDGCCVEGSTAQVTGLGSLQRQSIRQKSVCHL